MIPFGLKATKAIRLGSIPKKGCSWDDDCVDFPGPLVANDRFPHGRERSDGSSPGQENKGAAVIGIDPVLTEIHKRLQSHPQQWLQALKENPGSFVDLEKTVHDAFQQMADQLVAGLLAQATARRRLRPQREKKVIKPHRQAEITTGERRPLSVRLLGGLMIYVTTLYCSPSLRTGKGRGREGSGVYPELAVLGIQEGKTSRPGT